MSTPTESRPPAAPHHWLRRILGWFGWLVFGVSLLLLTLWAVAALHFDVRVAWLRWPLMVVYVLAVLGVWILVKRRWLAVLFTLVAFGFVVAWWFMLEPSNNRDWQPDLAVLPYANIDGNQVTIHNIRNCDYRTESEFEVRHYDKTFELDRLRTADLYMVYWGSPYMAHTMVSFGFEGGEYVCFSIEARKEKGEGYSAVKGFFRQFELMYVVSDERDVIRLRTNYRQGEEVYLFRLNGSPTQVRAFFMDYLHSMNRLRERAEWYNALRHNCTTSIRMQRAATDRAPWDWRMLANGYGDELLYERGMIATNLPLAELKTRSHVNARARAADQAVDFSKQIRVDVPGMNP